MTHDTQPITLTPQLLQHFQTQARILRSQTFLNSVRILFGLASRPAPAKPGPAANQAPASYRSDADGDRLAA